MPLPRPCSDLMKANGVERTVIIQVIHFKWDNSYVASVLKQYPDTFQGVARVNPEDPAAPDHLSRLVQEQGFRGVRLSPSGEASGDWIAGRVDAAAMEALRGVARADDRPRAHLPHARHSDA